MSPWIMLVLPHLAKSSHNHVSDCPMAKGIVSMGRNYQECGGGEVNYYNNFANNLKFELMFLISSLHSVHHRAYICKTHEKVTTATSQTSSEIKWFVCSIGIFIILGVYPFLFLSILFSNIPLKLLLGGQFLLSSHCHFFCFFDTHEIYF